MTRTRLVSWSALAATLWLAAGIAWAEERPWEWGWGMHPMGWMWGAWGILAMLMMFLFWGLVLAGIIVGIRWLVRTGGDTRSDTALDILRQRYARGEISQEEFETRKRDLG